MQGSGQRAKRASQYSGPCNSLRGRSRRQTEEAKQEENAAQKRSAERELSVLGGTASYLQQARNKIQRSGNVSYVLTQKIPSRILAVDKNRLDALLHGNHRLSHNYTDIRVGMKYRCPIPGCGGAIINQHSVKRALAPHCKVYRRTTAVRFSFYIETKCGWEVFLYPPAPPPDRNESS